MTAILNEPLSLAPKADTIFCPGCGTQLEVPKPKVMGVNYIAPKGEPWDIGGQQPGHVRVYFEEAVSVRHECPNPNRDKVTTIPESTQPAGRFRLWN